MGMSSESKLDAFVGDGATLVLWVGPPLQDILLKAKCL